MLPCARGHCAQRSVPCASNSRRSSKRKNSTTSRVEDEERGPPTHLSAKEERKAAAPRERGGSATPIARTGGQLGVTHEACATQRTAERESAPHDAFVCHHDEADAAAADAEQ